MLAVEYKSGNVPAHKKHGDGYTYHRRAKGIYIVEVFGSHKHIVYPKAFHKAAINHRKQNIPKQQQHLVLAKVQQQQLNR